VATNGEVFVYDAIVVGARCAGAPLAMLARQGTRVLLFQPGNIQRLMRPATFETT
jgi:choline dehydrogenase-like flavoprotein